MQSLRAKLLVSFCLAEALILAAIIGVVNGRLRSDTDAQKSFVSRAMEERARKGLRDHLRLLGFLLEEDQWDCVRAVEQVTLNADAVVAVQTRDTEYLQATLEAAAASAGLDLLVLYDPQGNAAATYPPTIPAVASSRYFSTWELTQRVWGPDTQAGDTWVGATRLAPEFLEAHGMAQRAGADAALGHVVIQVAADDAGDVVAIALGVKVLNGFHFPFERAHRISNHGAALYVDGKPVAWAGFAAPGGGGDHEAPPALGTPGDGGTAPDGEFLDRVLGSAAGPLLATSVPLRDLEGGQIGTLVAALPENRVRDAAVYLGASSDAMLHSIRVSVLLVGAGALAVFFCTALFIESRLISRPLRPVVAGLGDLAQGEADLTRTLPANTGDEVGRLANNFNQFLGRMRASVLRSRDTATDIRSSVETIQRSSQAVHGGAREQTENLEASHGAVLAIGEESASIERRTRSLVDATEASSSATQQMGATAQEIAAKMDELFQLVDRVSSSIHQMSSVSGQVSNSIETLAATTQQTAASISEMDQNIGQVRQGAEHTGSVAEAAAREALRGKQAVDATVAGVEALSDMVEESTGVIRTLAARSGEIGVILTTISNVAEQTSLLALNASIIAAQAGRHGTGFGVVANEIKTLAASTKASAREITGIVGGLQEVAKQAVKSTESGHAQVLEEVERAREAGGRLDRILASSEESRSQAAEIAHATQEQAEASRQITQSVALVGDMLGQITAAVQQQTEGYRVLAGASDSMRDIASQVKLGTDEQAVGSGQIAAAMEQVRVLLEEIDGASREQTRRSQEVLASVASALQVARDNTALSAAFDAAVATLTHQAETLQQEVGAFQT